MNTLTTSAYLSIHNYLADIKTRRDDQGASMLEYVGVLVLVAIVVGIVVGAVRSQQSDIEGGITEQITNILNPPE